MQVKLKLYSSYVLTYTPFCEDIVKRLYGNSFDFSKVEIEVEDLSNGGKKSIQSQRHHSLNCPRIIRVFEDDKLRYIIGLSNTNYDKDKLNEFQMGKSNKTKSTYGENNYHGNTYLKQGLHAIFNYYYECKMSNPEIALMFYLLDTDQSYPHNLFNVMSYRELTTIGYKILNLDKINFDTYNQACHSRVSAKTTSFPSFNKYFNDIATISKENSGNSPSFLICDEVEVVDEDGTTTYLVEKYIYTFKSLAAQGYDSFVRCLCLKTLADKEGVDIEFRLGKQYFAFEAKEKQVAATLTTQIETAFKHSGIILNYTTDETFMDEVKKADNTYLKHKKSNDLRNQSLFRNNLRKTGVPMECVLCHEDNPKLLDAAHIWEVHQIKDVDEKEVDEFITINHLFELIDQNSTYKNEVFFKKYSLVNSGENGVWLCKNHHKRFDSNYYCFDSKDGKILLYFEDAKELLRFESEIDKGADFCLPNSILTDERRAFISRRQYYFAA